MVLPQKIGNNKPRVLYNDITEGSGPYKFKEGISLTALKKEYEIFTYAPLFLYGGLTFNPIQEWINIHNHKQIVFIGHLNKPIIKLDPLSIQHSKYDEIIWLVIKEHWLDLAGHIGGLSILNRSKGYFMQPVCQEIPVLDVNNPNLPKVNIYTFGVDSNKGCLTFTNDLIPILKYNPPRKATIAFASALLNYVEDPYGVINK